jgi:hypothetical protein
MYHCYFGEEVESNALTEIAVNVTNGAGGLTGNPEATVPGFTTSM